MKRVCILIRLLVVLLAAMLLTLCGSCGKRNASAIVGGSELTTKTRQSILNGRPVPPLESLLAELDALQKPTSVDPQLWASVKNELRDKLVSAFNDAKETSKLGGLTTGYVKARDLQWEPTSPDTTTDWGKLTWRYVNDGDYNQDGQVKIDDVTPVAMHYGQAVEANNSIQELIDEDDDYGDNPLYTNGNGIIEYSDEENVPDDLDPIQFNFYADIACYEVFGREAQGNWVSLGTVPFSSRTQRDGERDVFSFALNSDYANYKYYKVRALSATPGSLAPPLGPEYWYHTNPNDPGGSIVESDVLELGVPAVTRVTPPPQGTPNVNVPFRATVTGASPYTYYWTFCLFASPQTSTDRIPGVTFSRPTVGNGTVQVTNRFGSSATFPFTIDIRSVMAPVIDTIYPSPAEGDEGTQVTFSAEARGVPTSYSWNFGGGAEPNTSSDPAPTVTLANPGPPYEATLTVSNDQGQDEMSFTLTVHGWAITPVDTSGTVNVSISLAHDASGEDGISYQTCGKNLRYARRLNSQWTTEDVNLYEEDVLNGVQIRVGVNNSLAFNPSPMVPSVAEPAIAYEYAQYNWDGQHWNEVAIGGLRYAHYSFGAWSIQSDIVLNAPQADPSLAFIGSLPYASYHKDFVDDDLCLAHETVQPPWNITIVDDGPLPSGTGQYSSLTTDSSGNWYIAYQAVQATIPQLRLARQTYMAGLPIVVDSLISNDGHPYLAVDNSIALAPDNKVWIAYLGAQYYNAPMLKVAREPLDSGPWEFKLIELESGYPDSPSLDITSDGKAGLAYCLHWLGSGRALKYVENLNGVWESPETFNVDATACSLAFTPGGKPSIAYVADGNLYYTELF